MPCTLWDKITLENSSATSEMACHKEKRGVVENNRLSYHRLKKMIHEKNKCNRAFPTEHGMKRHAHEQDANSINATTCVVVKEKEWHIQN
jgi:hypothetical protein